MAHRIILVDSDRAFATILKERLEATDDYEVTPVDAGNEALELIASDSFDMAIVDVQLGEINPHLLVRDIRGASPSIRIVLIPLAGEEVGDELKGVEKKGLLPKPFFVGDLFAIVGQAMAWGGVTIPRSAAVSPETHVAARLCEELASEGTSVDWSGTAPADASPVGDLTIASQDAGRWRSQERRITPALKSVKGEMRAEGIIVSVGEELIACVGSIGPEQASELAGLVSNSTRGADRAAKCLGESGACFGQSVQEGA